MSVITLLLHYFAQIDIRKWKSMDGFKLNCYFDILTNFYRENTICYCNSLLWSLYFSDNTEFSCYVVNNADFSSLLLKVNDMIGNTWKYLKNQITWMSWNIYQLYTSWSRYHGWKNLSLICSLKENQVWAYQHWITVMPWQRLISKRATQQICLPEGVLTLVLFEWVNVSEPSILGDRGQLPSAMKILRANISFCTPI